ncbi:Transcription factor bHLH167 [Vitis vinifera]|uniref:Transcription factor bHLH167 n=2 Tax=Vitis vinifera TaxID=29760 RepID=A0A438KBK9_VITVI|nr:Transcription factor bHLH167 [Vitis vinifera]
MTKMNGPPLKPDRKTTERNRRIHMKSLCFKLSSLIPPNQFKTSKSHHMSLLIVPSMLRHWPCPGKVPTIFAASYPGLPTKPDKDSVFMDQFKLVMATIVIQDMLSQQDQLEQAANYIKQLKERIEELKGRKELATRVAGTNNNLIDAVMIGLRLPVIDLRDLGSSLEVMLISGLNKNFMLYEVISVLEEEGAEVVSASVSTVGDKVFHSLHAQVKISRVGVETSRVWQRLQELIY